VVEQSLKIEPSHLKIVQDILDQYLETSMIIWVFGSRAKGRVKPFSDLDLVLESTTGLPVEENKMIDVKNAFEESDLPWKVDVLDWNKITSDFQQIILEHRIQLKRTQR
jgi:predicted nucleotidyltransferase